MTIKKFQEEINTLKKFFPIYCNDKHLNQYKKQYIINYKNENIEFEIELCDECHNMLNYSIERLKECPHDPKPRCRKCPNPCYEKEKYKQMAKMMRYSGVKLGLSKTVKKIKNFFKS